MHVRAHDLLGLPTAIRLSNLTRETGKKKISIEMVVGMAIRLANNWMLNHGLIILRNWHLCHAAVTSFLTRFPEEC